MPKGYGRVAIFDSSKGTVRVWSPKGNIPTVLANLVDDRVQRFSFAHTDGNGQRAADAPTAVDFYVTTAALDSKHGRRATDLVSGRYGQIVLPEAGPWLREKIDARVAAGADVLVWVG